jgi:hypothetical protein
LFACRYSVDCSSKSAVSERAYKIVRQKRLSGRWRHGHNEAVDSRFTFGLKSSALHKRPLTRPLFHWRVSTGGSLRLLVAFQLPRGMTQPVKEYRLEHDPVLAYFHFIRGLLRGNGVRTNAASLACSGASPYSRRLRAGQVTASNLYTCQLAQFRQSRARHRPYPRFPAAQWQRVVLPTRTMHCAPLLRQHSAQVAKSLLRNATICRLADVSRGRLAATQTILAAMQRLLWDETVETPASEVSLRRRFRREVRSHLLDESGVDPAGIAIYSLADPRDVRTSRYIGQTDAPRRRFLQHLNTARLWMPDAVPWWVVTPNLRPLYTWIRELHRDGGRLPVMLISSWVTLEEARHAEHARICECIASNLPLLNIEAERLRAHPLLL